MTGRKMTGSGQCLCGAVRFAVYGPLTDPHACHCGQCRRQSGHFTVGVGSSKSDFELTNGESLKWFQSSSFARRGFCGDCGSVMLWDDDSDRIGINAGCLDQPTGFRSERHIFVEDKADYYEITDGLPRFIGNDTPVSTEEVAG